MKYFLFNEDEKVLIEELRNSTPIRIWSEYIRVIFEYENYSIVMEIQDEIAESINENDEAITCKLIKQTSPYIKSKIAKLITWNNKIKDIKIARTLLTFTKSKKIEPKPYKKNSFRSKLKRFITGEDDIIAELQALPSFGHEQIICNPNKKQSQYPKFCNLIDAGLLIQFDNNFFQPIIKGNGYGFSDIGRKPFLQKNEIEKVLKDYELI